MKSLILKTLGKSRNTGKAAFIFTDIVTDNSKFT